jgi:hypothetical protein
VYDDVRYRTGTGTTSTDTSVVSDATLLRVANKYFSRMVGALVELDEDLYAAISTKNLTADTQDYSLDADSTSSPFGGGAVNWSIWRVEIQLDGINWKVASPVDIQNLQSATVNATEINKMFSANDPKYALFGTSLRIFPIPTTNVTNGLRIFMIQRPNEMTTGTDVVGSTTFQIGKEFLEILSLGISADIFERFGQLTQQQNALALFENGIDRMKRQVDDRPKDTIHALKSYRIDYS